MTVPLYEKILQLSGESNKAEIGAFIREFQHMSTPDTFEILKKVYNNNKYSDEKYENKSLQELDRIKNNCDYIRRCAILALIGYVERDITAEMQNSIKLFLLGCINDTNHGVREVILKMAPKQFDEKQLIAWYTKIRTIEDDNANSDIKSDYTAIRRGLIYVLGEKISYVQNNEKNSMVTFIHKILHKPRDSDPYVCAAAAEILGKYGIQEHIKTLKEVVEENEYPAHLRAEKAIQQISSRSETASPEKEKIYAKIKSLEAAIKILQGECEKHKKQIEEM